MSDRDRGIGDTSSTAHTGVDRFLRTKGRWVTLANHGKMALDP